MLTRAMDARKFTHVWSSDRLLQHGNNLVLLNYILYWCWTAVAENDDYDAWAGNRASFIHRHIYERTISPPRVSSFSPQQYFSPFEALENYPFSRNCSN